MRVTKNENNKYVKLPSFIKNLDPKIFLSQNFLVIDFETTNRNKGSALDPLNDLVLWVTYDNTRSRYDHGGIERLEDLLAQVRAADFIVAHNAKFELQWLYLLGIKPGSILAFDTLLAEYCIAGNRRWDLSLDGCASRWGLESKESLVKRLIHGGVCPSEIPTQRLEEYCAQDVKLTFDLFCLQRERLVEGGLLPVLFTRCLTCLALADIEANGMTLDPERVEEEYRKTFNANREILAQLHEITGGINPNSPLQVGEFLYDRLGFEELRDYAGNPIRTDKGGRKTGEDTILALRATTDEQRSFVDVFTRYVPLKKKLETLTKFRANVESGRPLRFHFNQAVTQTHRLSSNGGEFKVQGQNIDRDFKRLFTARRNGWLVGDCDAAQVEFRGAGYLGNDDQIHEDLRNHFDVHSYTASVLLKILQSLVTKEQRTAAKPRTFAPLFGATSGSKDEKRYNEAFRKKYKGIHKTQKGWTHEVLRTKKLKAASGLIFYWPDCKMFDSGYIKYNNEIFNYPIQSFCGAEIIPIALVFTWYLLKAANAKSFITNTIHDAVIGEVHPDEVELWNSTVKEAFTKRVYDYLYRVYGLRLSVPLAISYSVDRFWAQGKDQEFEMFPEEYFNNMELSLS